MLLFPVSFVYVVACWTTVTSGLERPRQSSTLSLGVHGAVDTLGARPPYGNSTQLLGREWLEALHDGVSEALYEGLSELAIRLSFDAALCAPFIHNDTKGSPLADIASAGLASAGRSIERGLLRGLLGLGAVIGAAILLR